MIQVRRRLRQRRFRAELIHAYDTHCAICSLRHSVLLDAAPVIADGEKLGEALVSNGLALCKLHHAAFDSQLPGITRDCEIRVHEDLLDERDGPMLEHGLRAFHKQVIRVPANLLDRPDPDRLALRFEQFAA